MGIGEKKLEMILTDERSDQGVGLQNIHNRLHRLYGRGLEIISEEGVGTRVKFTISGGIASSEENNDKQLDGGKRL